MNFVKLFTYLIGFALPLQTFTFPVVAQAQQETKASAKLEPRSGNTSVKGKVEFEKAKNGVRVIANIEGLSPNSAHGFHIHEKGDCSAKDASSAGGHFAPLEKTHGAPGDKRHHVGDMGNVKANKDGKVVLNEVFEALSLDPKSKAYIGSKAVVLHAKADDLQSQPAGDAGGRIACGVIQ